MPATYYLLRNIEPPDLKLYPENVRLTYWEKVVQLGLVAKDAELARGLDKYGKALRAISAYTRKHRKSAMTPTGKGDPSAPPLMPGRSLSRTRSLLAGRARANYAEFYWRYDAHTGDTWGKILSYQAKKGRDVMGLSPESTRKVQAQAQAWWNTWKRTHVEPHRQIAVMPQGTAKYAPRQPAIAVVGRTNSEHVTFGANTSKAQFDKSVREGRNSGFMTRDEWDRHFRESIAKPRFQEMAPVAAKKGAERLHPRTGAVKGSTNRLIAATWGDRDRPLPFTGPVTAQPKPPKPLTPVPVAKVMPIRPKPAPKPIKLAVAAKPVVATPKTRERIGFARSLSNLFRKLFGRN